MEDARKFFTEFVFSRDGNCFWFPVIINSDSPEKAEEVKKQLAGFLQKSNYNVRSYNLKPFNPAINSDALRPYISMKTHARVAALKLHDLVIDNFSDLEEITLKNNLKIKPQNLLLNYSHAIQSCLDLNSFLTIQFHDVPDYEKEFLILRLPVI